MHGDALVMPATTVLLRIYLGIDPTDTANEAAMAMAVDAANDLVAQLRPDLTTGPYVWPPRVNQAAHVEAARLVGRRSSVQGVAAFADLGVSLLPRMDPEVRSLLELGEYQPSVVS